MATKVTSLPSTTYEKAFKNAPQECSICLDKLSAHPHQDDPFYIECHGADHDVVFHTKPGKDRGAAGNEVETRVIHAAHDRCFRRWAVRQPTCPICREDLDFSSLPKKGISLRYHLYLAGKELSEELSEHAKACKKSLAYIEDRTRSIAGQFFQATQNLRGALGQGLRNPGGCNSFPGL